VANTLAYYDTATITVVKSFIVQAPDGTSGVFLHFFANTSISRDPEYLNLEKKILFYLQLKSTKVIVLFQIFAQNTLA
jgi:hypothetical protein